MVSQALAPGLGLDLEFNGFHLGLGWSVSVGGSRSYQGGQGSCSAKLQAPDTEVCNSRVYFLELVQARQNQRSPPVQRVGSASAGNAEVVKHIEVVHHPINCQELRCELRLQPIREQEQGIVLQRRQEGLYNRI